MASITPIFDQSYFANFFKATDPGVLSWAINVLDKFYRQGIVPKYITRTEGGRVESGFLLTSDDGSVELTSDDGFTILTTGGVQVPAADSHFIAFWYPLCIFWGYAVELARGFENFTLNKALLREHLAQRGYFLSNTEVLDKLQYLIENALEVRRERGSIEMYQPGWAGDDSASDTGDLSDSFGGQMPVDGELLRLFGYEHGDFFQLALPRPQFVGWNINNCSPMYTGCTGRLDMNLGYEWSQNIQSLSAYPLLSYPNAGYLISTDTILEDDASISEISSSSVSIKVLKITTAASTLGIGNIDFSKMIAINPNIDFEITFYVKQENLNNNFTFGCLCFDQYNNQINLVSSISGVAAANFFSGVNLNRNDTYYFVRGIIYQSGFFFLSSTQAALNIGFGQQLKFLPNAAKIIPYIVNSGTGVIDIWNLKVNICSLPYSNAYLSVQRYIDLIVKNNNPTYGSTS